MIRIFTRCGNVRFLTLVLMSFSLLGLPVISKGTTIENFIPSILLLLLDETDAPDVCGSPLSLTVPIGGSISEYIKPVEDFDYYKVISPNFYTNIKFTTTGTTDTVGELWNSTCSEKVDENDDENNPDLNFGFEYNLEPGNEYYLNVRGYADYSEGLYTLNTQTTNEYVYLSAKFSQENLTRGTTDPYHPEYPEPGYFAFGGDQKQYDSYDDNYYFTVDPNGQKKTLQQWKIRHGFLNQDGSELSPSQTELKNIVKAEYINAYDLGIGRKMSCRVGGEQVYSHPCVVENFTIGPDPDKPRSPRLFASVAMERIYPPHLGDSGTSFQDIYYTAFFVFDANGQRVNSIDLDGSGPKRVPESCWGCHDGNSYSTGSGGGQYLPFDIKLFRRLPGSKTINAQIDNFRKLNDIVYKVSEDEEKRSRDTNLHDQIAALILHWYNDKEPSQANPDVDNNFSIPKPIVSTTSSTHAHRKRTFFNSPTPTEVQAEFYGQYCQTCHVSQKSTFDCTVCHTSASGGRDGVENLKRVLCDGTRPESNHMPNAKVTHIRMIEENQATIFDLIPHPTAPPELLARMNSVLAPVNLCANYANEIYPRNAPE